MVTPLHTEPPPKTLRAATRWPHAYSMMSDFLRRAPTVSEGCAPLASHALMAGALRLDSFFMGSYQPSSCSVRRSKVSW